MCIAVICVVFSGIGKGFPFSSVGMLLPEVVVQWNKDPREES